MYDKELIMVNVQNIEKSLENIIEWTTYIKSVDDFLLTNDGMILLNAVCMKLIAIGEEIKSLDKHTNKNFLSQYTDIQWKEIMGMRDIIAHHYFEIDADKVFDSIQNDVPMLKETITKIKNDLYNN